MATENQGKLEVAAGVREGDILGGKYRVERVLGVGGMGVVVAAHHIQLDERVAIKFLRPEALGNAETVARFAREARAAVKIKSEHVARVVDVGTLETGAPYIVMEYLDGGDLGAWLEQRGALSLEQAVEFILQACEAIAVAHGLGIVHRDLKPSNLFCIRQPDGLLSVKVLDFGISKVTGLAGSAPDVRMTRTNTVFGSPLYMAPEQMVSAREADTRTDIWALGAILYELLAGKSPFDGDTLPEVYVRISTQAPPPLRDRRPDLPPGIEQVILKCLEKDRDRRYQNVAELAVALGPFGPKRCRASVERTSRIIHAAGLSDSTFGLPIASEAPAGPPAGATNASWGQTARATRKKAWLGLVAALGLVGIAGVATLWVVRSKLADAGPPEVVASSQPSVASLPSVTELAPNVPSTLPVPPPEVASAASSTPPVSTAATKANRGVSAPKLASARPLVSSAPAQSSRALVPPAKTAPANQWGGRL
jgi:serine/threonine-protein kinase